MCDNLLFQSATKLIKLMKLLILILIDFCLLKYSLKLFDKLDKTYISSIILLDLDLLSHYISLCFCCQLLCLFLKRSF